jgi:C-terminal processing protease CtpA/Prc
VTRPLLLVLVLAFTLVSCKLFKPAAHTPATKYSAAALKEDFSLLRNILEANHPSLYWYTPKDSVDYYFNLQYNSITDSLTELQFKNKVAAAVTKIRCGHTSVRLSKAYSKEMEKYRYPQFPLYLKVWDDSMVVLLNMHLKDSALKRGTVVTAINGKTPQQLMQGFFEVIGTDGYSDNHKYQVLSNNFPYWYKSVYGLDSSYLVQYVNNTGLLDTLRITNYKPVKDTTTRKRDTGSIKEKPKPPPPTKKPSRKEQRMLKKLAKRSMQIDTSINTAYIRITTFSSGRLKKFFKNSFRNIQQRNIKNVVIDLRENGGGSVNASTNLARYLVKTPFKIGDTVAAINRQFPYGKYIRDGWLYWFPMNLFARKMDDGRIHFRYYEKHYYKPFKKYHFDGNVYFLQGGATFSASTMVIATLKGQENVTVVGEETGGGYYGNTAMHLPDIVLPHTKLRITLPMYRLVMDASRPKDGRGILPDVWVKPSSKAIAAGMDIKLVKTRELIITKNQQQGQ